ncbi:E3 ubiquitin-protein ligase ATL23 [Carica papaya]|uniref:E3 ubiquitin-protein ligase ATL23 n=1 Tax=Carica papaya TaxID=3649 RepID=UPI000B8D12E8|nr:E3 ubiquitin-protein ligase ATL23 [Carica papaya]
MRHGVHHTPLPPILSPSPSPSLNCTDSAPGSHTMIVSVFLALFLPCAGMSAVFGVYICLLWYSTSYHSDIRLPEKPVAGAGLSPSELEKLPKVTGKELVLGTECAVCLDEIEGEQPARLVPGCNHGFHLHCADTWLSNHSVCPVCRAKLPPDQLESPC